MWRWDQGRLTYFSIARVRSIAAGLTELSGASLDAKDDPLRNLLPPIVNLPFAPENYRVWRNYARVFKILGLASSINGRLCPTTLCKRLVATGENYFTYDDYLQYLVKAFYYPSPVFQGYSADDERAFPLCSIIKYLIAKSYFKGEPSLSVEEVFSYLIGNKVDGLEEISFYGHLRPTGFSGQGDQLRQVREMLIFVSQLSFLSWIEGHLLIDIQALSSLSQPELEALVTPYVRTRSADPEVEVQNMFNISSSEENALDLKEPSTVDDQVFTEGRKVRVAHLRTERNRKVVKHYFKNAKNPRLCDVCQVEVVGRYPWLSNLIEVHHVLPLSSPLQVDRSGTSLDDLVGLCPNCHRATHALYKIELSDGNLDDFVSEAHAKETYLKVKSQFVNL